jgi:hypothetical protein
MDSQTGYLYRTALQPQRTRWRAASRALRRTFRPSEAPDPFDEVAVRDEAVRALAIRCRGAGGYGARTVGLGAPWCDMETRNAVTVTASPRSRA